MPCFLLKKVIFEKLRQEREKNRPRLKGQVKKNNYPYFKKELTYLDNVTNECTVSFYQRHGVDKIEYGLETSTDLKGKKVFSSRYCLRNELGFCSKNKVENIPQMPWKLEQLETGNKYEIEFDCKKCSMYLFAIDE